MSGEAMRVEKDSMGEMRVPEWALWGASTQRARENFPIANRPLAVEVVHAFGLLKSACAKANRELGKLDGQIAEHIVQAADEVAAGELDEHFVVDVYQTGSGTSTNMNANEVIANRVSQKLGKEIGSRDPVHPNDHVNMGQSSNDTFPTAMHVAGAVVLNDRLMPSLERLHGTLSEQAKRWDDIVKIGRTHLMDATPIRVGQVFGGFAEQAGESLKRAQIARDGLAESLAIGGTAVGTGINTHPQFAQAVAGELAARTGLGFAEAKNHVEAQATKDRFVDAHGLLKTIAVSLSKLANDVRWLGSGPRCGLGELKLPATQPGSSIMPGKVNPVMCESMMQVCMRVVGNDQAVTAGGFGGTGSLLELNVAMPMMADAFMESVNLLSNVVEVFVDKLLVGLEVDAKRCEQLIEQSLMMITSLAPVIGYDNAAGVAKEALAQEKTIRELVLEKGLVDEKRLNELLDPRSMTEPGA